LLGSTFDISQRSPAASDKRWIAARGCSAKGDKIDKQSWGVHPVEALSRMLSDHRAPFMQIWLSIHKRSEVLLWKVIHVPAKLLVA
jgi:hypothetical protein